jgi:hypothetical protein
VLFDLSDNGAGSSLDVRATIAGGELVLGPSSGYAADTKREA